MIRVHGRRRRLGVALPAAAIVAIVTTGVWLAAQSPQNPPAGEPQAPRQAPSFRTGIELVSLNVTVSEGAHYMTDLEQDNFSVYEDGVKQDVTFFSRTNLPIALALLLDTSASMDTKLPTAQKANAR